MITALWKLNRVQPGIYNVAVRRAGDTRHQNIPGRIIGGNGRWFIQRAGTQWPERYFSRNRAADALVRAEFGI